MTDFHMTARWANKFIGLAQHVAGWSKDPSTQVGAVLVDSRMRVIGMGYNGFPRGYEAQQEGEVDRETKLSLTVHAEVNAVLNATAATEGSVLVTWPLPPCDRCAALLINAGIRGVLAPPLSMVPARWWPMMDVAHDLMFDCGVKMRMYHHGEEDNNAFAPYEYDF